MRFVLLGVAVVVSLWPAAVIALGVERVLGGGEDGAQRVAARPATSAPSPGTSAAEPSAAAALDLDGLNGLRDDTAGLVVAVDESSALGAGQPDAQIAAEALDIESRIVTWQEANEGASPDAVFFAGLFAEVAGAAADYATAPSPEAARRLKRAVERHRRETLRGGA